MAPLVLSLFALGGWVQHEEDQQFLANAERRTATIYDMDREYSLAPRDHVNYFATVDIDGRRYRLEVDRSYYQGDQIQVEFNGTQARQHVPNETDLVAAVTVGIVSLLISGMVPLIAWGPGAPPFAAVSSVRRALNRVVEVQFVSAREVRHPRGRLIGSLRKTAAHTSFAAVELSAPDGARVRWTGLDPQLDDAIAAFPPPPLKALHLVGGAAPGEWAFLVVEREGRRPRVFAPVAPLTAGVPGEPINS